MAVRQNVDLSPTMLQDAKVTAEDEANIRALFDRYSTRAFMNEQQFSDIMVPLGLREDYCPAFFHAFDTTRPAGLLDFNQFFVGIIAIDPETPHGSGWMAERLAYTFAVYDLNDDGVLDKKELTTMIKHIRRAKGQSEDKDDVTADVEKCIKAIGLKEGDNLTFEAFLASVNALKFRGTSRLFRLPQSAFRNKTISGGPNDTVTEDGYGTSRRPRTPEVDSDVHFNGRHVFASGGDNLQRNARSQRSLNVSLPTGNVAQSGPFSLYARRKVDFIDPGLLVTVNDPCVVAMKVITNTILTKWEPPPMRYPFVLLSINEIKELCGGAIAALQKDNTLVDVATPCKVFGDIHGQMTDLLSFFSTYGAPNHRTGDINLASYVFLGDYVDRGKYSLEVILTLFALKIRYPKRVFLTRGNHEDRGVNAFHGFLAECEERLGEDGEAVWDLINSVMDWLPLAALIDGSILCVHGGIGGEVESLSDIRNLKRPLDLARYITDEPSVVKDLLWSDPTSTDRVLGVHANAPRGANMVAFGPDRVLAFCEDNNLGMIIRAHECVEDGYELFASGHLVTVFSATNYQGKFSNHGAYLEVSAELEVTPKLIHHPDRHSHSDDED